METQTPQTEVDPLVKENLTTEPEGASEERVGAEEIAGSSNSSPEDSVC